MGIRNLFRKKTKKASGTTASLSADADRLIAVLEEDAEHASESFLQLKQKAEDLSVILRKEGASTSTVHQLGHVVAELDNALDAIQQAAIQVCQTVNMTKNAGKKAAETGHSLNINNASVFLRKTLELNIDPTRAVYNRCRIQLIVITAEQERIRRVSDPSLQRDLPVRARPLGFKR